MKRFLWSILFVVLMLCIGFGTPALAASDVGIDTLSVEQIDIGGERNSGVLETAYSANDPVDVFSHVKMYGATKCCESWGTYADLVIIERLTVKQRKPIPTLRL